jgi:hypothetical protein
MFEVCEKQCDQCLFSNNKIVPDNRKKSLLKKITKEQGFFECHKSTIAGTHVCCKGFYDQLGYHSQMIRISERLNAVKFVKV